MVRLALIFIFVCGFVVAFGHADDDQTASRLSAATNIAIERLKSAANKGAQAVDKGGDKIIVKVERLVNPEEHQPGQSNLIKSAVRGAVRYTGSIGVEAGRTVSDMVGSGVNFIKKSTKLTGDTVRQMAHRLYYGRSGKKSQKDTTNAVPAPTDEGYGSSPVDELQRVDGGK